MDLHLKSPLPLSTSRSSSTFPLTHGSQPNDPPPTEEPVAGRAGRSSRRPQFQHATDGPSSPNPAPNDSSSQDRPSTRPLIEPLGFEGNKSHHHRHKHSKSRELRLPRPMSHLASSASARGLLPTWSGGRDKDREGDDGLLRPVTRETTRTRWGSDSASGLGTDSRKGSLLDTPEQHERLGPIRRQEIQSMEDLEKVKKRRKQGEEYLRSALSSIGTLATDVTRRLDYTYYNLLEKITALNSTIGSFQELSESASTLLSDFERETANLDQDIRRQISDLKGFQPQMQKVDALEERMKRGRQRVEDLGKRLEDVRREIDRWERRESEWQSRVSRRLRIFWAVMGGAFLVLVLALILQNWPVASPRHEAHALPTEGTNRSSLGAAYQTDAWESILGAGDSGSRDGPSRHPSSLENRRQSLQQISPSVTITASVQSGPETTGPTEHDSWRVLDEL